MLWRLESHLTYKPTQNDYGGFKRSPPLVEAFINDEQNNKIHVAYHTADSSRVILFAHGRDGNMTKFGRHYSVLDALGYSYITFDYPGFGRSSGTPTERSLYTSSQAVLKFAKSIFGVEVDRIVFFGLSLGAAITLELALGSIPTRLVLESPFTSSRDMGRYILGSKLPLYLLVPNRYRNSEKIQKINAPILILNGTADTRIPHQHSKLLFDAGGGPRTLVTITGASHLNIVEKLSDNYQLFLREFIEKGTVDIRHDLDHVTILNS